MKFEFNKTTVVKLITYLTPNNQNVWIYYKSDSHIGICSRNNIGRDEDKIDVAYKSPNFYKVLSTYYPNLDEAIAKVEKLLDMASVVKTTLDYFKDVSNDDKIFIYQSLLNKLKSEQD